MRPTEFAWRPEWYDRAACRGLPTAMFFPESKNDAQPVIAICTGCPVRVLCLGYGKRTGAVGVGGGRLLGSKSLAQAS